VKTKHAVVAIAVLLTALSTDSLDAQGFAGEGATMEPTMMINKPTAGMLKRGGYLAGLDMVQGGGVLFNVSVGLWDRFMFGISYGGANVIGNQRINMNPLPGVEVKLRIIDESLELPAIALGFNSQGKEPYIDGLDRYTIKSPGFYLVGSKNYSFAGNLSFHGGLNLSTEGGDGDKDLNVFAGVEKSLGKQVSAFLEYDFAFNDNHASAIGLNRGYLNLSVQWSLGSGLVLAFNVKDIFQNQKGVSSLNRSLRLDYVGVF
jgi:hypothetical protein